MRSTKRIVTELNHNERKLLCLFKQYPNQNYFEANYANNGYPVQFDNGYFFNVRLDATIVKYLAGKKSTPTNPYYKYALLEEKPIGTGAFGTIYGSCKTFDMISDSSYSIKDKCPEKQRAFKYFKDVNAVFTLFIRKDAAGKIIEIKQKKMIDHAFDMLCRMGPYFRPKRSGDWLIMHKFPGINMNELFVKKKVKLNFYVTLVLFRKILCELKIFHERGKIVHRDIKLDNILVNGVLNTILMECAISPDASESVLTFDVSDEVKQAAADISVKIVDTDLGKAIEMDTSGTGVGSPIYASPEVFKQENVDELTDVFSAWKLLRIMIKGYFDVSRYYLVNKASDMKGVMPSMETVLPVAINKDKSDIYHEVYELMCRMNLPAKNRITLNQCIDKMSDIIQHCEAKFAQTSVAASSEDLAAAAAMPSSSLSLR